MTLCPLRTDEGQVWINPLQVIAVRPSTGNKTTIWTTGFRDGKPLIITVAGKAQDVIEQLDLCAK